MRSKKLFSFALIFLLLISAVGVNAFAEEAETEYDFIINGFDSTYYNDGKIVFNNYGTVYNNGNCGVVYNNGGIVYNNGGTVYNNCGVVYNNSGTVFNNCGEVVINGKDGIIIDNTEPKAEETEAVVDEPTETDDTPETAAEKPTEPEETAEAAEAAEITETAEETFSEEQEKAEDGRYKISLAADYSRFAYIEGNDKSGLVYTVTEESEITVTPKPGYSLLNSFATTGRCTLQEDGSIVFGSAERDGTLTLTFKADEPVVIPKFGTYGEPVSVKIIAGDGVTVYYTTDGNPVCEESAVYNGPIEIKTSSFLEVMAAAEGAENSRVFSGYYLIPLIKAPQFESLQKGYEPVEPQPIIIENTGLERLKIASVKLTGIDANCFTLSTEEGARIDSGQSSKDTWTVAPVSALNTGTYEAAVEFTFADGNTAAVELSFTVIK